jgi:hypothetical protein
MATTAPKGYANAHRIHSTINHDLVVVAGNDQAFTNGTLITITDGVALAAAPGDIVEGVSLSVLETTSTNETVEKKKVLYRRPMSNDTWLLSVDPTDTVVLDETTIGQYFVFTADQYVDPASAVDTYTDEPMKLISVMEGGKQGEFVFIGAHL